jgi:flagellar protein FliO/FliZ
MNASSDLTMTAIKMFISLAIVLFFVVLLYYIAKRFMQNPISNENKEIIKILSNKYLGLKRNLYLVEIPGSVILLGVTNESISLLGKIDDKEIVNKYISGNNYKQQTFVSHLQRVSTKVFSNQNKKNTEDV